MSTTLDTILAIDLGRYKSVACVYHRSTREHTFCTIDTRPAEFTKLLARHPQALVVIEACANAGWVHDHAVAAGHTVKVANTAAESWKFQHLKRKTDHDDARRLAELEAIGPLPTVALPDLATRQRRMLSARLPLLQRSRLRPRGGGEWRLIYLQIADDRNAEAAAEVSLGCLFDRDAPRRAGP